MAVDQELEQLLPNAPEAESLTGKMIGGKWSDITAEDIKPETIADLIGLVTMHHGGVIGNLTSTGASAFGAIEGENTKLAQDETNLDIDIKEAATRGSDVAKAALKNQESEKTHGAIGSVFSTGGGAVGGALGAMIPVAGVLGLVVSFGSTIGGSIIAQNAYEAAFKEKTEDAKDIIARIITAQNRGIEVPPEAVFAAAVASLPEDDRVKEKILKALRRETEKTGQKIEFMADAVRQNKTEVLHKLMTEYGTEVFGLTFDDPTNSGRNPAEIYAELINNKQVSGRALIFNKTDLSVLEGAMAIESKTHPTVAVNRPSSTSVQASGADQELQAIANEMNRQGVMVTIGDNGQPVLVRIPSSLSRA